MTFSRQILAGLALGILTGLFFGERAAALKWAADGFVKLLQMMVLPYITVSIVASLGSLRRSELRTLGLRAAAVIGGLWLVALSFAFLIPLTFPAVQSASFFSSSLVERRPAFDFIDLYIPANPFNSLANNVVPAVVLFSLILGIAVVGVERRERLLDVLQVARDAISAATRFVTRLTPYGLFAIAANAAGTLGLEQLGRLQIYLVAYVAVALMVSLWVLPGLVAALTPIRAQGRPRRVARLAPHRVHRRRPLHRAAGPHAGQPHTPRSAQSRQRRSPGRLTEVIVPASFNFPHTGKLLSLSFVLFAGWFADAPVPLSDYPQLALAGLVTFFGSLTAAVPFLLDQFRIPADTFQLFLATGVINSRVGSLVAAVHTLTVALLVSCAVTGHLRWRRGPLLSYAGVTAALVILVLGGTRLLFATDAVPGVFEGHRAGVDALAPRAGRAPPWHARRRRRPSRACRRSRPSTRARCCASGTCRTRCPLRSSIRRATWWASTSSSRIGWHARWASPSPSCPWIENGWRQQLAEGYCDLVMSGVVVTTNRAREVLFSDSYLDETLAFVVPDDQRDQYATWDAIRDRGALTIAVPDVPYYVDKLRDLLPRAVIQVHAGGIEPLFEPAAHARRGGAAGRARVGVDA